MFTGLLCLSLVFCSCSKTAVNKGNFKKAVQAELDKAPVCISAPLPNAEPSWRGRYRINDQLEALVGVGLVNRSRRLVQPASLPSFGVADKPVPGYYYELTEEGRRFVHGRPEIQIIGSPLVRLCYGTRHVDDVVRYTEPSPAMGMTMTEVTYTWNIADIASWAKDSRVQKAFYMGREPNGMPQENKMALILSNDGWHAESHLRGPF